MKDFTLGVARASSEGKCGRGNERPLSLQMGS